MPPISMKGINRKVVPYVVEGVVEGVVGETTKRNEVVSGNVNGLDLFLDVAALDDQSAKDARQRLKAALAALDRRGK